jgi:hypothetical protein
MELKAKKEVEELKEVHKVIEGEFEAMEDEFMTFN